MALAVSLWIGFGGPKPPPKLLPMSTDSCTQSGNMTAAEICNGESRWDRCKIQNIYCWPIRCHSVFAGWINYTGDIVTLYSVMVLPALRMVCVALQAFTSKGATHIEPDLCLFSSQHWTVS